MVNAPSNDDRGIHYIAVYKGVKAVAQIILAIALLVASREKTLDHVHGYLVDLQDHVSSAWSQRLVAWMMKTLTPGNVHIAALICAVDGVFTAVEGWALHTRRVWGEWLVVAATGGLIPFEIYEIIAKPRVMRVLVLAVNVAVVAYLARRQWRRHAFKKASHAEAPSGDASSALVSAPSQPGPHLERPMQSITADARD